MILKLIDVLDVSILRILPLFLSVYLITLQNTISNIAMNFKRYQYHKKDDPIGFYLWFWNLPRPPHRRQMIDSFVLIGSDSESDIEIEQHASKGWRYSKNHEIRFVPICDLNI